MFVHRYLMQFFPNFISTTGKRVLQTGRARTGIVTLCLLSALPYMEQKFASFTPLHTDSFALTSLGSEFVKTIVHGCLFFAS